MAQAGFVGLCAVILTYICISIFIDSYVTWIHIPWPCVILMCVTPVWHYFHTYWQVGYVWYVGYGCCVSWMSGMTYLIYIYDISHVNIQSHRDGVSCIWYLISVSDIYDISHVNIQLHRDGVSCIIHRLNTIVCDSLPIGFKLSLPLSTNSMG